MFRYAKIDLDSYFKKQKAMDKLVNILVDKRKTLLFIGSANFSQLPIKKHRRTPGLKKLLLFLRKKRNCTVILVPEHYTSQVCGKCFKTLHKNFHEKVLPLKSIRRNGRVIKQRCRVCFDCKPGKLF